ncbi:uroporphyrinogen-III synthase [Aliihoeflea sp. PC F10.4]
MARRVLVTRPEPGAGATAKRLAACGFEPVVLPLTRIVPVEPAPLPERIDAVVATSANAFRHAPPALLGQLADKPLYVVGEKTAAAAKRSARSSASDAAALADKMIAHLKPSSHILHLAGRVRHTALKESLEAVGHKVVEIEVYDAVPFAFEPGEIGTKLGAEPFWSALVYSQRGGEILRQIATQVPASFASTVFVCISREAGSGLADTRCELAFADSPDEAGMLDALERLD